MLSLGEQAYERIRRMIVRLDLAPGAVIAEDDLQTRLGIGRTPIREALQRLAREQFVTVVPRRGAFVTGIDVDELALLYETRAVLEPYAARLAASRGTEAAHWAPMVAALDRAGRPDVRADELIDIDQRCHELIWAAAGNRFLTDTLDTLYAQSDRVWHMYLAEVADMADAVTEHIAILAALRSGDADGAAALAEQHVRAFDAQIRAAVTTRVNASPLAAS
ncbi:GntR family transcriptional regulator [soil metagenome]